MHRAVSIFMAALLLTQIASYSFNEIPPQIEWEEPMQGDKDWKVSGRNNTSGNNTGGNNTGGNNTGGNNSSSNTTSPTGNIYITMYGYYSLTPSSYYESGYWWPSSTVSADFNSSNLSLNSSYTMTWALLSGWSTTQIISSGNASWTAYNNTSTENVSFNLSDGQYMFQVYLYGPSGNYLGHDMSYIQVGNVSSGNNTGGNNTGGNNTGGNNTGGNNTGGNNTGGNNTGGNNTGGNNTGGNNTGGNNTGGNYTSPCGSNLNYTSVYAYSPYMVMENQSFTTSIYVNCEIYNANMILTYWIYDTNNYTIYYGNQSWTSTNNSSSFNWAVNGLSAGYYTFHAEIYVNNTFADSDNDGIYVYTNNTGGNNTGGNNTGGNNTGGNNTGGNNTGGNNTGGNNTGGNSTLNDGHCLILSNLTINQTYYVTLYLVNTCSFPINYPGINASADNSNVYGLYDGWWYQIGWSNSSYAVQPYTAQLTFNSSIQNGTNVTLDFEATVMNCGQNNSWSHQCPNSTLSITFQYFAPSNSGGNNTGGNNTGGNNTGGNNTDGNNTGGNNTGGNNTGGNNTSATGQLHLSTNGNQFEIGDTVILEILADNLTYGSDYDVYYYVYYNNINGSYNFTAQSSYNINNISFSPSYNGTICMYVYLYNIDNSYTNYLDYEPECVTVGSEPTNNSGGNNTGGNNTGGNNTGGNNTGGNSTGGNNTGWNNTGGNNTTGNITWGNISVYPSTFGYYVGDMVYFSIESYYLQPGATYEVDWEVYKSGQTIDYGIYSWTATSTIHQQTDSTFLNNSGTHCVTAWLNHVDSNGNLQYLSTDTSCFSVSYNYSDMDNDGIDDSIDNCLNLSNPDQSDMDGDGIGDACEYDSDNDGVIDDIDNCLNQSNTNQSDIDGDGIGDICDSDIDGDGVSNGNDVFPYDENESGDFDGDGIGDNADPDDDNDGMTDVADVFPYDSSEQIDTDGDGIGNNADTDDDGDGITDILDNCQNVPNPDQQDLDGDGIGSACDGIEDTVPDATDGNETDGAAAIPALGAVGTLLAVTIGFIALLRREEE